MTERNAKPSNIRNIRTYVLGLIYRNSFTSVRVPSSMALAEKFSVTRRTARTVLEGLISEGYLIGRNGVGTFTNPHCGFRMSGADQRLLIGVGSVRCNNFYYDLQTGTQFAEVVSALCRNGVNVFPLTNMPGDSQQFVNELSLAGLDGAVICSSELQTGIFDDLIKSGFPVVAVQTKIDGADFSGADYRAALSAMFEEMRRNGEKELMIFLSPPYNIPYGEIVPELADGINYRIVEVDSAGYFQSLEDVFSGKYGSCDRLVCSWRAPQVICRLREKYGVPAETLRVTLESDYICDTGFSGSYFDVDQKKLADAAVKLLKQRIASPSLMQQTELVNTVFVPDTTNQKRR